MGKKGDKLTQSSVSSAEAIVEKLTSIGDITSKKMFGGQGIFNAGKMFCIFYSKGVIFMKADDSTKADYQDLGGEQHSRMPYFSIPLLRKYWKMPENLSNGQKRQLQFLNDRN